MERIWKEGKQHDNSDVTFWIQKKIGRLKVTYQCQFGVKFDLLL